MSNNKIGNVLKSVRRNLGRVFEPGAEKALQDSPKSVDEFLTSISYEFEVTDKDEDDNKITIIEPRTGVICNNVPKLAEFINEKRGFPSKIKLQADGGQNTMKVTANFQKIGEDISDTDQIEVDLGGHSEVEGEIDSVNLRKSARISTTAAPEIVSEDEQIEIKPDYDSDFEIPPEKKAKKQKKESKESSIPKKSKKDPNYDSIEKDRYLGFFFV